MRTNWRLIANVVLFFVATSRAMAAHTVSISAGKFDRHDTIVTFPMPAGTENGAWMLDDGKGTVMPVQIDADRQGSVILKELRAGESRVWQLQEGQAALLNRIECRRDGDVLHFVQGKKELISYQGGPGTLPAGFGPQYQRGGYISTVYTPSGKLVSDDYPPKHQHHHGIWTSWTNTEFEGHKVDFWNMGDKKGRSEFVTLDASWSGDVHAGLRARHRYLDLMAKPEPKVVLNEQWEVRVYAVGIGDRPYYLFDLTCKQECASDQPLIQRKYHYGGLGFRGNREWDGVPNCQFLTADGKGRSNGNETRGNWCYVGGKVDGQMAGVTVFCWPDNFRSPQGMRLNPTEPFFSFCASQQGDWKIEPGVPYVARYRFLSADGEADKALIGQIWNDLAEPPGVIVK